MLPIFDGIRDIRLLSVLARTALALLCSAAIGLERSAKNRPAGFRTHVMICLAAMTVAMTGHYLYLVCGMPADVTRMSAQVLTGLGFLGAGTIIVTRMRSIKGLTTAAGLWATGVIGLCFGAGFYEGGLLGTALVLLIETAIGNLGRFIKRDIDFQVFLRYSKKEGLDQMMRYCKDKHLSIKGLQIRTDSVNGVKHYTADITLHAAGNTHIEELLAHIRAIDGIDSVER